MKSSTKEAWEVITVMCVGSDRAKKATTQLLKQEYANLKFKDGEMVEDFSLHDDKVHLDCSLYRDDAGLVHPHH